MQDLHQVFNRLVRGDFQQVENVRLECLDHIGDALQVIFPSRIPPIAGNPAGSRPRRGQALCIERHQPQVRPPRNDRRREK